MTDEISDKLLNLDLETLSIDKINERINKEVCYETITKLNDENLRSEYLQAKSVKTSISKLELILNEFVSEDIRIKIIDKYISELIPPGTKGCIRGNKFNDIVKTYINNLGIDSEKYEIRFEAMCQKYIGDKVPEEIPDWYILEKETDKVIIGMNQLDLWSGGQQVNRGYKYIKDFNFTQEAKIKIVCVVCNHIQFKSSKNKAFRLFEMGYGNNTLCYLNNLDNIIKSYFNI